jgi:hypothetical protein
MTNKNLNAVDMRATYSHFTRYININAGSMIVYNYTIPLDGYPSIHGVLTMYGVRWNATGSSYQPAWQFLNVENLNAGTTWTGGNIYSSVLTNCPGTCIQFLNTMKYTLYYNHIFNAVGVMIDINNSESLTISTSSFIGAFKNTSATSFQDTAIIRLSGTKIEDGTS